MGRGTAYCLLKNIFLREPLCLVQAQQKENYQGGFGIRMLLEMTPDVPKRFGKMILHGAFGQLHNLCYLFMAKPFFLAETKYLLFLPGQPAQGFFDEVVELFCIQPFINVIAVRQRLFHQQFHEMGVSHQPAEIVDGLVPGHRKNISFSRTYLRKGMTLDPEFDKDILYDLFCSLRGFTHFENKGGKIVEIRVVKDSEGLFITF